MTDFSYFKLPDKEHCEGNTILFYHYTVFNYVFKTGVLQGATVAPCFSSLLTLITELAFFFLKLSWLDL